MKRQSQMDPWCSNGTAVIAQKYTQNTLISNDLAFEDNFTDKLPDSAEYLAILETKLKKLKSSPGVLAQLRERREACMRALLTSPTTEQDLPDDLESPIPDSPLVRTLLPHRQALTEGELVELLQHDSLNNEQQDQQQQPSSVTEESTNPR